jgi:hypothetical protein
MSTEATGTFVEAFVSPLQLANPLNSGVFVGNDADSPAGFVGLGVDSANRQQFRSGLAFIPLGKRVELNIELPLSLRDLNRSLSALGRHHDPAIDDRIFAKLGHGTNSKQNQRTQEDICTAAVCQLFFVAGAFGFQVPTSDRSFVDADVFTGTPRP